MSTSPASIPSTGLEKRVRIPVNSGTSARGATALLMVFIPNINTAKPSITVATFFSLSLWENMRIPTPMIASMGEKDVGLHSFTKKEELSIPAVPRIQEVIVVPILAPMIIPTACCSFMMLELTNPTTITVVAEDD